ncbi:phosphatidate cytidylyltransferase [Aequitasia blattaphilus]|uniref:Phosphatidate cytidylyltransferase n=1 Tax=Aequitasia blattaphilus TaxID=2949332 RepID=A0ABT1EC44_9FIRM|nr:phosphatidate cytidylyltransferase [Aequitasia blattaphilus]MCP1103395.1 phosphatidate cytidylyltransferase [Aequitasia blattaphilus]MCR8616035.1 phosphatidate cytidylyltransferase [Aequitasia blattaphilus]
MFKSRLLSGIVLVLVLALVIGYGSNVLLLFCGIISLIGMWELNRVVKVENKLPGILTYICGAIYYLLLFLEKKEFLMGSIILALIVLMASYVFAFPKYHGNQIITAFFGFVYVAVMISYIYQARMLGLSYAILIFLGSWGSDTCAYCVGMLLGKHKMAPKLSPKKSVEGAVGGVVGAIALGVVFGSIVGEEAVVFGVICGVGALISMIGDLAASAIKRNYEIKDYGHLIPGHGGILDRFDSVIFTAPVIYYMAVLLL